MENRERKSDFVWLIISRCVLIEWSKNVLNGVKVDFVLFYFIFFFKSNAFLNDGSLLNSKWKFCSPWLLLCANDWDNLLFIIEDTNEYELVCIR